MLNSIPVTPFYTRPGPPPYGLPQAGTGSAAFPRSVSTADMPGLPASPPQYYLDLGTAYYRANRLSHAVRAFDAAIWLNGTDCEAYNKRGVAKAALKDYAGAFADYNRAIAINPGFYKPYANRGNLWIYLAETARRQDRPWEADMHEACALADYEQAIRLNPLDSLAYENRSELWSSRGMKRQALQDRAIAIRLRKLRPTNRIDAINRLPRIALVLANDDYRGTENDLNGGPLRDASGIKRLLRSQGFQVLEGTNLTGAETRSKVSEFVSLLCRNPHAVSLVYYSGHGGSIDGNNYLIPVDFSGKVDPNFETDVVSVNYLLEQLKSANPYFNMIFLDACRTPLLANRAFSSGRTVLKQWETEPGPGLSNTWIEYASRPKKPAIQSDNQGLYTKYLLRYMARPDLNLREVSMYTSEALENDPVASHEGQHARTQTDLTQTAPIAESFYFARPTPGRRLARLA